MTILMGICFYNNFYDPFMFFFRNLTFILFFMFILFMMNFSFYYMFLNVSYFMGYDLLSFCMIMLSIWICVLMFMATLYVNNFYSNLFSFIMLLLVTYFKFINILYILWNKINSYVVFNFSLSGLQAGIYLLFYTLLASLPMMI